MSAGDAAAEGGGASATPAPATPAGEEAERRWPCALALLVLLIVGGPVAWAARAQVNPDGICYLQLASFLAEGDVERSISGYWSPLFVWLLSPLLALGVDRLLAARLVLLLWAGVNVVASDRLASRLGLAPVPRAAALVTIALATAALATQVITPDIVVSGCLLAFAACALHPDLFAHRWRAALAGAAAGVAYLAKSYALPFTLVHLPLTLALRWLAGRRQAGGVGPRAVLATWAVAMVPLAAVALPWIVALSWHYGRPTWATVGAVMHASVGPHVPPGTEPYHDLDGLRVPPAPHRSVWETPDKVLPYPDWSPLRSWDQARHQGSVIACNAADAVEFLQTWSLAGLTVPTLVLAPVIVAVLARRRRGAATTPPLALWAVWVPATAALYLGGYLLVWVEERYLRTFLLPLVLLLLAAGASAAGQVLGGRRGGRRLGSRELLAVAACATFVVAPARELHTIARSGPLRVVLRGELQRRLAELDLAGPLAVVHGGDGGSRWSHGQELAFYLDLTYVGTCGRDARSLRGLDDLGVATVFAPRLGDTPEDLGPGWVRRSTLPAPLFADHLHVDVFVRR